MLRFLYSQTQTIFYCKDIRNLELPINLKNHQAKYNHYNKNTAFNKTQFYTKLLKQVTLQSIRETLNSFSSGIYVVVEIH